MTLGRLALVLALAVGSATITGWTTAAKLRDGGRAALHQGGGAARGQRLPARRHRGHAAAAAGRAAAAGAAAAGAAAHPGADHLPGRRRPHQPGPHLPGLRHDRPDDGPHAVRQHRPGQDDARRRDVRRAVRRYRPILRQGPRTRPARVRQRHQQGRAVQHHEPVARRRQEGHQERQGLLGGDVRLDRPQPQEDGDAVRQPVQRRGRAGQGDEPGPERELAAGVEGDRVLVQRGLQQGGGAARPQPLPARRPGRHLPRQALRRPGGTRLLAPRGRRGSGSLVVRREPAGQWPPPRINTASCTAYSSSASSGTSS